MALQPGNVPHLKLGLDDVRSWIKSLQSDGALADDPSFPFVSNWCTVMEEVLEEYGFVLEKRTTMIYYLDLACNFGAHGLKSTYDEHGGLSRREKCSRFPTVGAPRVAREEVPRHLRLCQPLFNGHKRLAMFIYEPDREIFIWSYSSVYYGDPFLFAQSSSSGKQLPPISDSQVWPDRCHELIFRSYSISGNGRNLGTVHKVGREILLITIWEIEVALDFTRRLRASSWARLIHRSTIDEPSIVCLWERSSSCFGFDQYGVCLTPNGLVRTASGASPVIEDSALQHLSKIIPLSDTSTLWYSQNGRFLFVSSARTITKYSIPGLETHFELYLSDEQKGLRAISPNGRYFAYTDDPKKWQSTIWLVDTLAGNTVVLPFPMNKDKIEGSRLVQGRDWTFSFDDRAMIACFVHKNALFKSSSNWCIGCYTGLPSNVRLRSSANGICDGGIHRPIWHASCDHEIVYLVNYRGEIQRIALGDEIRFMHAPDEDTPDKVDEVTSSTDFISQDGSVWGRVNLGNDKAQLQYHSLLNPDEKPRCIELRRSKSRNWNHSQFITMSMDLSILVVNGDICNVGDSKTAAISMNPQTLKLPKVREYIFPHRTYLVDASNSYVAYLTSDKMWRNSPEYPDNLALFRINSDWISSFRLQPSLPKDMYHTSIEFHSSSPLLVLGFSLISEAESIGLNSNDDHIPYHVLIIDMNTMSKSVVQFKENPGRRSACRDTPSLNPS